MYAILRCSFQAPSEICQPSGCLNHWNPGISSCQANSYSNLPKSKERRPQSRKAGIKRIVGGHNYLHQHVRNLGPHRSRANPHFSRLPKVLHPELHAVYTRCKDVPKLHVQVRSTDRFITKNSTSEQNLPFSLALLNTSADLMQMR